MGGDDDCTVSYHPTGLHHNQYVRCGLGLVHLANGFQRSEERRGEERRGEERRGEERRGEERRGEEREREQNTRCGFHDTSYAKCDSGNEKLPWALLGK
jgi:hypothetical protein